MNTNPYEAPMADEPTFGQSDRGLRWLRFSFQGRARRLDYWKGVGISYGLMLLVMLTAIFLGSALESELVVLVGYVILIPFFWMMLAIQVKRWHDRDKSGWWLLIGFVPYIGGIWQFVECGCLPGTAGSNRFGADPKGWG